MKVFIINLEHSKDRKNFMQEQIQKLFACNPNLKNQLEFEFFKAIDGSKNEHLQFKSHFPWWCQFALGRELSDSEKSCFASHYSLWEKCQELNNPIIILEDDVIFNDQLKWEEVLIVEDGFDWIEISKDNLYQYDNFSSYEILC
ncbi:glycosyltransferase family 25 protein [Campylobacter lari]|nr:glycosyltransferase family 25 protein [Campylobacter lari]EAK9883324.1 glycosyltransferase family 25 protein [Campylobacter lari]